MTDDTDPMERDPRENRLPAWVQARMARLRSELAHRRDVDAENARLREVIKDKYGDPGTSDTFLVHDDTGTDIPLGAGAYVRFGDYYTAHHVKGVLHVETSEDMSISPTYDPREIIISQG